MEYLDLRWVKREKNMRSLTSLTIEEMGCFLTWAPKSSNNGAMINGLG